MADVKGNCCHCWTNAVTHCVDTLQQESLRKKGRESSTRFTKSIASEQVSALTAGRPLQKKAEQISNRRG